jgi:hypothetical protein
MFETLLTAILIWVLIGFCSAFLNMFVFFRGLKHMIDCHVNHKNEKIKHIGILLLNNYNSGNSSIILFSFFIIYTLLGPIAFFVLIRDFFKFTFQ